MVPALWLVIAVLVLLLVRSLTIRRLELALRAAQARAARDAERIALLQTWRERVEGDPRWAAEVDHANASVDLTGAA